MAILILNHADVEQLLPMSICIDIMAEALQALSSGQTYQPLRTVVRPPEAAGLMALMPAHRSGDRPLYGLKAVCVFPGNPTLGKDAHQGGVLLFSGTTGEPLALIDASAITAIRTAAVSGVATRLLARPDACDLALIGTGVQAHAHLAAIACVRHLRRVRVASRSFERAKAFAEQSRSLYTFPIEPAANIEVAVRDAHLIVTATSAREPIIERAWLLPGVHINAVGSSLPTTRELDTATVAAASLFVDRRESTLHESGDYLFAERDGVIGPDHIRAEIGELLLGTKPGRTDPDELTLFKSLGLAVEDLAAAEYVFLAAQQRGIGTSVAF